MSDQDGPIAKAFSWLPTWVGFIIMILTSIGAIIGGALVPEPCLISFGSWGLIASILAWATGAKNRKKVTSRDPDTFGHVVSNVSGWAWIVIFVLFLGMVAVCIFL